MMLVIYLCSAVSIFSLIAFLIKWDWVYLIVTLALWLVMIAGFMVGVKKGEQDSEVL